MFSSAFLSRRHKRKISRLCHTPDALYTDPRVRSMAAALASTAVGAGVLSRAAIHPCRPRPRPRCCSRPSRGVSWSVASASASTSDERRTCEENDKDDVVIDVALKEWGAVVAALAAGKQTVIFRKGGLKDGGKGFKLQATSFALFPTVFHPNEVEKKGFRNNADAVNDFIGVPTPDMKQGESVPITVTAQVTGAWVTHDQAVLDALSDHHVWTRDVLASRLAWKPATPITVLELRVKKISAAADADTASRRTLPPDLELYGGCKSWVDLPFQITPGEVEPALNDEEFRARGQGLRVALSAIDHSELDMSAHQR